MKRHAIIALLICLAPAFAAGCSSSKSAEKSDDTAAKKGALQEGEESDGGGEETAKTPGTKPATGPASSPGQPAKAETCPMMVEGVSVSTEASDGGHAMVFTTDTGDVADLQKRVANMAKRHNMMMKHHGGEMGMKKGKAKGRMKGKKKGKMKGKKKGMHGGPMWAMKMPPAEAKAENIDKGAKLVLTPKGDADSAKMKAGLEKQAEMMNAGNCPMMSGKDDAGEEKPEDGEEAM